LSCENPNIHVNRVGNLPKFAVSRDVLPRGMAEPNFFGGIISGME
jgi:hypothetical protein